ncbi:hypothetical protein EniLVp02_0240 [Vibrio phage EniLVp02]
MATFISVALIVYFVCNLLLLGLSTATLIAFHEKPPRHFTLLMILFGVFVWLWSIVAPSTSKEFEIK